MSTFSERFKKQGLRRTIGKGFEKISYYGKVRIPAIAGHITGKVRDIAISLTTPEYRNPTPDELAVIEASFGDIGIVLHDHTLEDGFLKDFRREFDFGADFYGGEKSKVWMEKIAEHAIVYQWMLPSLRKNDLYVDVAANASPWVFLLSGRGYNAVAIDLKVPSKFSSCPNYKKMDATRTSFDNDSVSYASLQCAFEMFEGNDDTQLVRELARILKKGGRALILPLYMHTHYCGYTTREFRFHRERHDKGARLYLRENASGIPFSRKYDVGALQKRVLSPATEAGLEYKISVLRNARDISEDVYCHFILELVKR